MIRNYNLHKKAILFVAPMFLLLLASCGSYQYSGYEDGIYGDSNQQQSTSEEPSQYANNNQDQGNSYYKNLFSEKSEFYGQMLMVMETKYITKTNNLIIVVALPGVKIQINTP